jgi:hypothetical protein
MSSATMSSAAISPSTSEESMLDLAALAACPLAREPYDHIIVPGFLRAAAIEVANADFPAIHGAGSFPVATLAPGPGFQALLAAMQGPGFEAAMAEKFGVALADLPTIVTVRGRCREKDGQIHTDTESKVITVLVYLNQDWSASGGRLRVLRGPSLEDWAAEVPPIAGTLLAFRRSEHSWHGHEPFAGERRVLQMNWVTEQKWVDRELARHRLSARVKRLNPFG